MMLENKDFFGRSFKGKDLFLLLKEDLAKHFLFFLLISQKAFFFKENLAS